MTAPIRRVYVAGPMRGRPEFGFPIFDETAATLRRFGYEVFSPAERDREHGFDPTGLTGWEDLGALGFDLRAALADDLNWIARHADALCVLDGWHNSVGARLEVDLARALRLPVLTLDDLLIAAVRGGRSRD